MRTLVTITEYSLAILAAAIVGLLMAITNFASKN